MTSIDPKDAGTVVSVVVEDLMRPAAQPERQVVVVRVLRHLRRAPETLPPGAKVGILVGGLGQRQQQAEPVREFVVFSASLLRYDATRIGRDLRARLAAGAIVRVSTVRALMASTRLPQVRETTEFEEAG